MASRGMGVQGMAADGRVDIHQGNGWARRMREVAATPLVAVGFLTVLPLPQPRVAEGAMGWAVACFPLVGAALGALLAAEGGLLELWLPSPVVAALLLATLLATTGALHLDGLMDSFDGLFGGRDPESRLAIMRDSRVGSYGIAAAASILLVEYGCLVSLPAGWRLQALATTVALSRWAMVAILWGFPAASARGMAAGLKPYLRWVQAAVATVLAFGIALLFFGWLGGAMEAAALGVLLLGGRVVAGRLGGINGDTCGGIGQLVEVAMLLLCVGVAGVR